MLFIFRKFGDSLAMTEYVVSNDILKPKGKRKPPVSPVSVYNKDYPSASDENSIKTSPKQQSTLEHSPGRCDETSETRMLSYQDSSFTNENLNEEQQKITAQSQIPEQQTEVSNEELLKGQSKTRSILPETVSPRSHQSITLGSHDGKSSHTMKSGSNSGSQLAEERKHLDKSIFNLLQ